jgi:spore germination protein GerM
MKAIFALLCCLCCAATFAQTQNVKLFLVNAKLHPNNDKCDKVSAVTRAIPVTPAVASAALRALFSGVTESEKSAGYESLFSEDTADILKKVNIKSGVAYVNLTDEVRTKLGNATSNCGRETFFAQTEQTLMQFTAVKKVVYAISDSPKEFYAWMEFDALACRKAIHRCTSQSFK